KLRRRSALAARLPQRVQPKVLRRNQLPPRSLRARKAARGAKLRAKRAMKVRRTSPCSNQKRRVRKAQTSSLQKQPTANTSRQAAAATKIMKTRKRGFRLAVHAAN